MSSTLKSGRPFKKSELIYMKKTAVFGSGAFGTCLATAVARKSKEVKVWHMKADEAKKVNEQRENFMFLKTVRLPDNVSFSADVAECLNGAELILFVIPTQFFRGFLKQHAAAIHAYAKKNKVPLVICSKGIERSTLKFPLNILRDFITDCPICVLAGPSFAIEVANQFFTNVCVACEDINEARRVQHMMTTPELFFRCWAMRDCVGCEVASAAKNVLAIASGISSGMGQGLNARASLIARGLLEIRDLSLALDGSGEAVFGLAGLGDLLLTCSSELSRNFTVGNRLGKGETLEEITRTSKAVAEGVATAQPLFQLAKKAGVAMPICRAVAFVLSGKCTAKEAFDRLVHYPLFDEGLPPLGHAKPAKL